MIHISITQFFAYIGPFLGFIGRVLLEHYYKVKRIKLLRKKDPVAESVKNNIIVEYTLEEILKDFEADRAYILQFHNGGNFYPSGKSIPKFSIFYEKTTPGTTILRDRYQNIPVSIFNRFFNYLAENCVSYYEDIKKSSIEEFESKGFTRETDAKSAYCVSIKTLDDKFMGVLVIQYIKRKKILSEVRVKEIQICAASLSTALSSHPEDRK
jgi:hypothetical protein